MVEEALSTSQGGLKDWLIQRVTAVILAAYLFFLVIYCLLHPGMSFGTWQGLFASTWMRVFSFFALVSLAMHTWVGMWTVLTDYVKCVCGRLFLEVAIILALIGYVVWGVEVLWRL